VGVAKLVAKLRGMDQTQLGTYKFAGHEDRYQYFLAIACAMVFLGLLMGGRTIHFRLGKFQPWHA
jgi:hypothetical protein